MKLGTKLIGGFLLVALVALVIGLFGYFQIHRLEAADSKIYQRITHPLGQLVKISTDFQRIRTILRGDFTRINGDKEKFTKLSGQVESLLTSIDKESELYEKTIFSEDGKKLFMEFRQARTVYGGVVKELFTMAKEGRIDDYFKYIDGGAGGAGIKLQSAIAKLVESKIKHGGILADINSILANRSGWIMLALAVAGALLAFVFGAIISRSIILPVSLLADNAQKVASGDLTISVTAKGNDEIAVLTRAFQTMTENLRSTIQQVSSTSSSVAVAANRLTTNSEQIAKGTEEVVEQAETVVTADEEISATANDIAHSCQRAAAVAQEASAGADQGAKVVSETVHSMEQIAIRVRETAVTVASLGERSDQIGTIVGTIEDIADQTNLLALNAAIEAARAGEMGRGFAVVADEVRALAERTTKATREIGEMIRTIQAETRSAVSTMEAGVQGVEKGTSKAARSGEALENIREQVNQVTLQISQVATAAEEQTATINEISKNMQKIKTVIQNTSAGVQESATSASQLSDMANELQMLVKRFKL